MAASRKGKERSYSDGDPFSSTPRHTDPWLQENNRNEDADRQLALKLQAELAERERDIELYAPPAASQRMSNYYETMENTDRNVEGYESLFYDYQEDEMLSSLEENFSSDHPFPQDEHAGHSKHRPFDRLMDRLRNGHGRRGQKPQQPEASPFVMKPEEEHPFLTRTPTAGDLPVAEPVFPSFWSPFDASIRGGGGKEGQERDYPFPRRTAAATSSSTPRTFRTYNEFASYMQSRKCVKCSKTLIRSESNIKDLFQNWLTGKLAITSLVNCAQCNTSICMGCGSKSSGSPKTQIDISGTKVAWCCSRGRLFLLWAFLCGFDMQYWAAKQREANTTHTGSRIAGKGVGYGGEGYSGGHGFDELFNARYRGQQYSPLLDMGKQKAQNNQQIQDNFNKMVYLILQQLLPSLERPSSFDSKPPEAVTSMVLNSQVLDNVAELLRNDSLDDVTKRKDLYTAALGFLRIIGLHPATALKAVFSDRERRADGVSLATLSFGSITPPRKTNETSSSLADCLRNLNIQSNMILKGAQNNKQEFQTQEGRDLLWLCRQISDLSQYLLRNTTGGTGATVQSNVKEDKDHDVAEAPDDKVLQSFHYSKTAMALQQPPRGRMKRLITEITNLKTSLPAGIFVKHATSRLDVMKIVIIGPEGTPYENGLFEFDLFCPAEYPQSPPKVYFRGTEGGMLSINPNLHSDGKVCLSLLNTWPGEPWRPDESTILQVLISIQAMIFCDQPMCNEPSFERMRGTVDAADFNREVKITTVNYGILKWAEQPPEIWQDVVQQHFAKRGNRILQKSEVWAQERQTYPGYQSQFSAFRPASIAMTPSIVTVFPRLQRAMQKYGATYVPSQPVGSSVPIQHQQGPGNGRGGYESSFYGPAANMDPFLGDGGRGAGRGGGLFGGGGYSSRGGRGGPNHGSFGFGRGRGQ